MAEISRRRFIGAATIAGAGVLAGGPSSLAQTGAEGVPIIDSHIHLFDGTRPLGAEYMGSPAYRAFSKKSLPAMYSPLARKSGIVGAIVVESSSWIDDNLWTLQVCREDPFMVGVCGSLDPARPDFAKYVHHFAQDPLFRAIRCRVFQFYEQDAGSVRLKPECVANLKILAEADLALDTANPSMDLMRANAMLAAAVPNLRIIMDHLPSFDPASEGESAYREVVKAMADCPNISVKLSEVYHPRTTDGVIVKDYGFLSARLEYLYQAFGEDRVIFGSDYPNSYGVATIPEEVGIMKRFFSTKPREAAEKYFWRNSARVYKWKKRAADQPSLG